jgi:hypothetical protein
MRVAALYDGIAGGVSYFRPDRPRIDDPAERRRVADYLRSGAALVVARVLDTDWLDPALPKRVPVGYATDGTWTWNLGLSYYVEHYGISPDPELYSRIRSAGYTCAALGAEEREAAMSELYEHFRRPHTHEDVTTG